MTYRGIVQNGLVILEDADGLRNGQQVEVSPARHRKTRSRVIARRTAAPKGALPSFGLWRNRKDLRDAAAAARSLRKRVSRRAHRV